MNTNVFMKCRIAVLSFSVLVVLAASLSSCSSNRLVSSWTDPTFRNEKVTDVLVIGVFRDQTIKKLFENSFARELAKEQVKTFTGHSVDALKDSIVYDTIVQAAKETGAQTVLITRYIDATSKTTTRDSVGRTYVDMADNQFGPGMFYATPFITTSSSTKVKVHLLTSLYDVATRKLIWSARSEVVNPVMKNTYFDSVTSLYVGDLKKNNFL